MLKTTKHLDQDYYEKYWSDAKEGNALFEDVPIWGDEQLLKVTNFLKKALRGKVLDAGCGVGEVTIYVSKLPGVTKIVGLDIAKIVINMAKKEAKKMKIKNVEFIQGSVTKLPFADKEFDTILSLEVIEHIIDVKKMLLECNRVLKLGGFLALSTVELSFLKRVLISFLFFESYFNPETPHIRFFTRKTLEQILGKTGFKVITYNWTNSYLGLLPMGQMILARKIKHI